MLDDVNRMGIGHDSLTRLLWSETDPIKDLVLVPV